MAGGGVVAARGGQTTDSLVVAALAALRLGFAAWGALAPAHLAAGVGVPTEQRRAARPYVRALAARELVLGVGTLASRAHGGSAAGWVAAMALSDGADAAVYLVLRELGTLEEAAARRSTWFAASGLVGEGLTAVWLARRHGA